MEVQGKGRSEIGQRRGSASRLHPPTNLAPSSSPSIISPSLLASPLFSHPIHLERDGMEDAWMSKRSTRRTIDGTTRRARSSNESRWSRPAARRIERLRPGCVGGEFATAALLIGEQGAEHALGACVSGFGTLQAIVFVWSSFACGLRSPLRRGCFTLWENYWYRG